MATIWRVYTIIALRSFVTAVVNKVHNVDFFCSQCGFYIEFNDDKEKRSSQAIFTVDSTIKPTLILLPQLLHAIINVCFDYIVVWHKAFLRFFIYFTIFYLFRDFLLFGIFLIFRDFLNILRFFKYFFVRGTPRLP